MKINIKDKLAERKISRYELAKRIGVTYPTITAIFNSMSTSIKLDILESICKELNCTPNDILVSDDIQLSNLINKCKEQNSKEFTNKILNENGIAFDGKQETEIVLDSVAKQLEEYIKLAKQNKD